MLIRGKHGGCALRLAMVKLTRAQFLGGRDGVMASSSIPAAMPTSFVILRV